MQTIILAIQGNIIGSAHDRLITALKGMGTSDHKLTFGSVKILDVQTDDDPNIWICQIAIADPHDTITAAKTCQEVKAVIKGWASSLRLRPEIAFQVSRSITIRD